MSVSSPTGWTLLHVRDLIEDHFCGPSPTCDERPIRDGEEWGLLKTTAITWEAGWDWRQHKVPPRAYWHHPEIEVHSGDVLVTKAGPRHRVGVVCHVPETPPRLMVSGKMIGLRPGRNIVPQVLAGALSTAAAQKFLDQRTTGMAESQVNFANLTLLATPLNIPPLPEQRRIAAILDTLDDAIRRTEQVIAKLQQMKQGLLHDLLTRGVDEHGDLRPTCDEAPHLYKGSPMGQVPAGWSIGPLGSFFTLQRGFDITVEDQLPGSIPVVSSSGITSFHAKAMVSGPGVVTGRKGKLGDTYYLEGPFWPHDTTLWVKDFHGNNPKFAAVFLGAFRLERFDAATSVPTLNRNTVHPVPVAIPPADEQLMICERLESAAGARGNELLNLDKLRSLKIGLLHDLLTGRVRVPMAAEAST